MSKSILVIDTPSSCSECELAITEWAEVDGSREFIYRCSQIGGAVLKGNIQTNCPLISIDIDELKKAAEEYLTLARMGYNDIGYYDKDGYDWDERMVYCEKIIKSLIDKLKGNGGNE